MLSGTHSPKSRDGLTLEQIARFAESKSGKVYRDVCERFGVDPARDFYDDFLAFQFRLALAIAHPVDTEPDAPAEDPFEAARRGGAEVKALAGV